MEENQKTMLRYLTDVDATYARIKELEEKIAAKSFRLTPTYGSTGGSSGTPQVSKVERYVEEKMELEAELSKCRVRLTLVEYIRESGVLSEREYELIEWLQIGGRMSEYARQHGIYKSQVYKIRDNALRKVMDFVQNTPKCRELWGRC